jgi:hypothetical protein
MRSAYWTRRPGDALLAIGVQERVRGAAVRDQGQLPGEIVRVHHPGVHALAAGGRVDVRGVAGEQHAPAPFRIADLDGPRRTFRDQLLDLRERRRLAAAVARVGHDQPPALATHRHADQGRSVRAEEGVNRVVGAGAVQRDIGQQPVLRVRLPLKGTRSRGVRGRPSSLPRHTTALASGTAWTFSKDSQTEEHHPILSLRASATVAGPPHQRCLPDTGRRPPASKAYPVYSVRTAAPRRNSPPDRPASARAVIVSADLPGLPGQAAAPRPARRWPKQTRRCWADPGQAGQPVRGRVQARRRPSPSAPGLRQDDRAVHPAAGACQRPVPRCGRGSDGRAGAPRGDHREGGGSSTTRPQASYAPSRRPFWRRKYGIADAPRAMCRRACPASSCPMPRAEPDICGSSAESLRCWKPAGSGRPCHLV